MHQSTETKKGILQFLIYEVQTIYVKSWLKRKSLNIILKCHEFTHMKLHKSLIEKKKASIVRDSEIDNN